eukprot:6119205-Pyramimonas_sp.AAC.1
MGSAATHNRTKDRITPFEDMRPSAGPNTVSPKALSARCTITPDKQARKTSGHPPRTDLDLITERGLETPPPQQG